MLEVRDAVPTGGKGSLAEHDGVECKGASADQAKGHSVLHTLSEARSFLAPIDTVVLPLTSNMEILS